jgi:hypothetical protein
VDGAIGPHKEDTDIDEVDLEAREKFITIGKQFGRCVAGTCYLLTNGGKPNANEMVTPEWIEAYQETWGGLFGMLIDYAQFIDS